MARELIRGAVGRVFTHYYDGVDFKQIVQWFDLGGTLQLDETAPAKALTKELASIQGLMESLTYLGEENNIDLFAKRRL